MIVIGAKRKKSKTEKFTSSRKVSVAFGRLLPKDQRGLGKSEAKRS